MAEQRVDAAPGTNAAAEVTVKPRVKDMPSREGAHEERAKVTHSVLDLMGLRARARPPGERSIVLFNAGAQPG